MDRSVEALKQVDLVDFLSRHYGLEFRRQGAAFACRSPFSEDRRPSFFVRLVKGHWLFKDFSSGAGGTIFDFVRMKEKLESFSQALSFIRRLLPGGSSPEAREGKAEAVDVPAPAAVPKPARRYDVDALYEQFRREDPGVCRQYLLSRGIDANLVEALIGDGTVVHNRHDGRSWCTFAVRDEAGPVVLPGQPCDRGEGEVRAGRQVPLQPGMGGAEACEGGLADGRDHRLPERQVARSQPSAGAGASGQPDYV